ncbi:tetratricopeptide repeat protein [Mucilaginibacter gracilis]|uniref:Tetratricopeptide repeat protein n=1 Tax=Mucilaginibacter gracilis TaxID=423350 RepID=A0A495J4E8_9SPHI|nr:tetratricopeptide repeat protein [Mucilaginibacter gracilis]RKR83850.1 tetratricopeptide repeat protein [Mucilaginibacter gracilis]
MLIRKITLLIACICFTSFIARAQSEAMKDVINNLALYHKKNDVKYLGDSKKSVDATFKTHSDSVDMGKNVYKAMVYATILNIDSVNKLNLPDTMLLQTTKLVNRLLHMRKIYRYNLEMNYSKGCLANVYQRKAFDYYTKNNYRLAISNFNIAKRYVPAAKEINVYLANIYYKLGNYKTAVAYYDTVLMLKKPRLEHIQTAANVYKTLGDTTRSLQIIQQGLDEYPGDKYLLSEEANIYNNQKNYDLLKPVLNNLMTIAPNDPNVIFMAANCYDHLNDPDRAEQLYHQVIDINNNNYDPIFNLGLLYLKKALHQNKPEQYQVCINQSQNWLEKASEMAPNSETCLKALQMLYLQTGDQTQLKKVNNKLNQLTN